MGQLLVGMRGGRFRVFFMGRERKYNTEPFRYDPTPSLFVTIDKGENILILEVEKLNDRNEEIKIAANICDFDGDKLEDITFDSIG